MTANSETLEQIHPQLRALANSPAARLFSRLPINPHSLRLIRILTRLRPITTTAKDVVADTLWIPQAHDAKRIKVLSYRPKQLAPPAPFLLWLHGGGYVMGKPESDAALCEHFARELGAVVVAVQYRLAPEHPYPAALHDSYCVLNWAKENALALGVDVRRMAVGGASAGGGLAASLAQYTVDRQEIDLAYQLLVYPMLDDRTVLRLEDSPTDFLVWDKRSNRFGWQSYLGASAHNASLNESVLSYAVPARRQSLAGLPPAWIGVGSADMFYEEDISYAERLQASGVPCEVYAVPGAFHGFDVLSPNLPLAQTFLRAQTEALRQGLRAN
ncbi:MAG TPA: alpha/beta hydrolase [Anaerolineales bacterium]|nr:alpha/beta hydrolase [Anaerolineales bacterium]